MPTSKLTKVIKDLLNSDLFRQCAELTDAELLERFLSRCDAVAIEVLVRRHSPMVWGVCRRLLRNHHDAEDAFQAVFLVLTRKAASIRPREMVANWLYGVAHRTASKARAMAAKRSTRERQVAQMPEPAVPEREYWPDLQPLLDQELSHLSDKYRAVIVLCDLEGKTRKEASRQLRLPEGTIAGRLARARRILAKRLAGHGLALAGGTLATLLSDCSASACVPPAVVASTIKAVTAVVAGQAAVGMISTKAALLTEGVLKAMLLNKLKMMTTVVLGIVFLGAAMTSTTYRMLAAQQTQDKDSSAAAKEGGKAVLPESIVGPGEGVQGVAWAPGGKFLAVLTNVPEVSEAQVNGEKKKVAHDNCTVKFWDVEKKDWMPTTVRIEAKIRVHSLAVSPDDKILALALHDFSGGAMRFYVRIVGVEKGDEKKSMTFGDEGGYLGGLAFSPDGTLAVWGNEDPFLSVIKHWDADKGELKTISKLRKEQQQMGITRLAFSQDGKSLAFAEGMSSHRIRVVSGLEKSKLLKPEEFATAKQKGLLDDHSEPIFFLAFSPDAKMLVSASHDNTVKIWDVKTDKVLHNLTTDGQTLCGVALSADGKTLAMGIAERKDDKVVGQQVKLWNAVTGELQKTLKVGGTLAPNAIAFSPDGKTLATGAFGADADYKTMGDLRLWTVENK